MKSDSKRLTMCTMTAAVGVVLMLLGSFMGLGMYMAPIFVGWCLVPIGRKYGMQYQAMLWIVIGLLSMLLVSDMEQNLMFIGFFGWYPIVRAKLQTLPRVLRLCLKLLIFNAVIVALEAIVLTFLVPEVLEAWLAVLLLAVGNMTFLVYDYAFPMFDLLAEQFLKRLFP